MTRAAEILFASIVDYAGTFPPASQSLAEAMATYARHRRQPHQWMLGRFVLAASSLEEFEMLAPSLVTGTPWAISLVGRPNAIPDATRLAEFTRRCKWRAAITAVEFGPMPSEDIPAAARRLPDVELFFEVPVGTDVDASLRQIGASRSRAKIRTGGITPDAFPDPMALTRFLQACHAARVAFKATAGLHHALCGQYPLTYAADSPRSHMFGFLNVALAAAAVHAGGEATEALEALRETSTTAFHFTAEGISWRERRLTTEQVAATRRDFFKSFGSCSFGEPVDELTRFSLLPHQAAPTLERPTEVS